MTGPDPEAPPDGGASPHLRATPARSSARLPWLRRILGRGAYDRLAGVPSAAVRRARRLRGPWRIAVVEGSMLPAIEPGDWLLVDPSSSRWPRRGSIVVYREPGGDALAIKRLAGGPGDRVAFADGFIHLGPDEAWLVSDADPTATEAAGFGPPRDSRTYGPVPVADYVARAWFRYGPVGRIGRIGRGVRHERGTPIPPGTPEP